MAWAGTEAGASTSRRGCSGALPTARRLSDAVCYRFSSWHSKTIRSSFAHRSVRPLAIVIADSTMTRLRGISGGKMSQSRASRPCILVGSGRRTELDRGETLPELLSRVRRPRLTWLRPRAASDCHETHPRIHLVIDFDSHQRVRLWRRQHGGVSGEPVPKAQWSAHRSRSPRA